MDNYGTLYKKTRDLMCIPHDHAGESCTHAPITRGHAEKIEKRNCRTADHAEKSCDQMCITCNLMCITRVVTDGTRSCQYGTRGCQYGTRDVTDGTRVVTDGTRDVNVKTRVVAAGIPDLGLLTRQPYIDSIIPGHENNLVKPR